VSQYFVGKKDRARWQRVVSLVNSLIVLFDSPALNFEHQVGPEYGQLLADGPFTLYRVDRLISLLESAREAFALGQKQDRQALVNAEIDELILFLEGLKPAKADISLKTQFNPKNLGLSFIKKNFGLPLFGSFRPPEPPKESGTLLCYRMLDTKGRAELQASHNSAGIKVEYTELGLSMQDKTKWMQLSIFPIEEAGELANRPSSKNLIRLERHVLKFSRRNTTKVKKAKESLWEPAELNYVYFFFDEGTAQPRLRRFLEENMRGLIGAPPREAEKIANTFIQGLL